jgi:hypothetical protein
MKHVGFFRAEPLHTLMVPGILLFEVLNPRQFITEGFKAKAKLRNIEQL